MSEKSESFWKWAERGKLVVDIIIAFVSERIIRGILHYIPYISTNWASVVALFGALVILLALIKWQDKHSRPALELPNQTTQVAASYPPSFPAVSSLVPGLPKPTFDVQAFYRASYFSPLTAEAEKNMLNLANEKEPNDPAAFLARFIGVGLVSYLHEHTWHLIFKSQILMLQAVNAGNIPLARAHEFYDKAAVDFPQVYATYSFDNWLTFMKAEQVVIQHPSDMLEITWKGKDFLKYLAHWGYDISHKFA